MVKHPLSKKIARDIQLEAEQIARSLQTPDQTREQSRLIARGIQRGIETYQRQQAAKSRELDKERKKLNRQTPDQESAPASVEERIVYRQHWLPWALFLLSLVAIGYLIFADGGSSLTAGN